MRPAKHIFVGSKAPWFKITDDLPQFEEHAAPMSDDEVAARSLKTVSAISLFVEDLQAAKSFYRDLFDVDVVFEDDTSVCVKFGRLFVNLLHVAAAHEQVEPAAVASRDSGSRFQLSIWVDDVEAVCALLQKRGVMLLTGPDRPGVGNAHRDLHRSCRTQLGDRAGALSIGGVIARRVH